MSEDKIQDTQERIDLLMSSPESFDEEQMKEITSDRQMMQDYETAMQIRQAILQGRADLPDPKEEFGKFKSKHIEELDSGKQSNNSRIIRMALLAAACLAALLVVVSWPDSDDDVKMLRAAAIDNEVTLYHNGKAIEGNGNVNMERSSNNKRLYKIDVPKVASQMPTEKITMVIPAGKMAELTLPDGTKVMLNSGSHLIFPATFPENGDRQVTLQGEAFFDVAHDEKHPFNVVVERGVVSVLGTKFNVRDYGESKPVVTLLEGSVAVTSGRGKALLAPGEKLTLNCEAMTKEEANIREVTAWTTNRFYFEASSLKDILTEIARTYSKSISFETADDSDDEIHFSSNRDEPLNSIIDQLNMLTEKKIKVDKDVIVVF